MSRLNLRAQPRRVLGLATAALACWTVVVVAVFVTPAEDGANIGAGLVGLLAIGLTIASALTWNQLP